MLLIAPLTGLLLVLRHAAPTNGRLAGAIVGVAAACIATTFFVLHCSDDSPLFVAVWYLIAIGIVALAGNLIGARVLQW